MARQDKSFRVGRVRGDLRGKIWYLTYYEHGKRNRPRSGHDVQEARRQAAEINSQLENGAPVSTSYQSIAISDLQNAWLDHHEHVSRSSVSTISRYRSATSHLLNFLKSSHVPESTGQFQVGHAMLFVKYLRQLNVSPNGHANSAKRHLRDKGIRFILEVCRSMFHFADQRRHLPPYAQNPFTLLHLEKMPVEDSKPVELFSREQEAAFLKATDLWQFPIFFTLIMTGLRPGELSHLYWPDDVDQDFQTITIRNRIKLGWQVKTRRERTIPIHPVLSQVFRKLTENLPSGTFFRRRRFNKVSPPLLSGCSIVRMEKELQMRISQREAELGKALPRSDKQRLSRTIWRDAGMIKPDQIRTEFMRACEVAKLPEFTSPKMLRHLFATSLQEGHVDPMVRNELMGHSVSAASRSNPLGMTATYTHTRPETVRQQLENAMRERVSIDVALDWLKNRDV